MQRGGGGGRLRHFFLAKKIKDRKCVNFSSYMTDLSQGRIQDFHGGERKLLGASLHITSAKPEVPFGRPGVQCPLKGPLKGPEALEGLMLSRVI